MQQPETGPNGETRHRWSPSLRFAVAILIVLSLIVSSPLGNRLPMLLQDVAFLLIMVCPFVFVIVSWMNLFEIKKTETPSWRFWVSVVGCICLTYALGVPLAVMFFRLPWSASASVCLSGACLSLLAGIVAAKTVRFPLFFGGLIVGSLVFIIPVGTL